ncbi:MAG: PTS glucose transporter subunit IIA, partial [Coprobacillus sp.]
STYVIGKSRSKNEEVVSEDVNITVYSPIGGKNIALSETNDPSFASEALGKGFAIIPNEEEVVSPIEGTITVLFPTKHAIGITDKNGLEILIHIGIDTVQLVGEGFEAFVEVGQTVKKGEKLVKFDSKLIKSKGYDLTTFVVVTNTDHYKEINHIKNKEVKSKDAILSIA